jgi:acetyl esterase/lipase
VTDASDDPLGRTTPLPDAVLRYGDHPDAVVDLHVPAASPRGTVVVVHGGFWRSEYDRTHTRPVADALRRAGFLVASPEYRRTGAHGDRRGGWPQTPTDVRDAVTRLPGLLAGLGLPLVRPLVLLGHSAGGHLVLWLAAEGVDVDRVVALAPVGDLRDAFDRDLDGGAVRELLGGGPDEHPRRYADADPSVRLADPPDCELVVVHGSADRQVPLANSGWARPLDHVELRVLDGVDHFAVVVPESDAWPAVLAAVTGRG